MELKKYLLMKKEQIFLDGEEIHNVTAYKLESSADSGEPVKLTVTILVNVDQIGSGLQQ